jgi:predicted glycosyltransferase
LNAFETVSQQPIYTPVSNLYEMRLWIDISNAPHVLLFKNLIHELSEEHELLVTTRSFGYIEDLLEVYDIDAKVVGKHGGRSLEGKLDASFDREQKLLKVVKEHKPEALVNKCSIEGSRIAYGLGIKNIVIADNEFAFAQDSLTAPLSSVLIIPEAIDKKLMAAYGARDIVTFPGVCEVEHMNGVKFDKDVLEKIGVDARKKLLTIRTGPLDAHYFNNNGTSLPNLIRDLDFEVVAFTRNCVDAEALKKIGVTIPENGIDTMSLVHYSDVFLGEGGSMNRESCLLGTPTISCYPQELLAVDRFLISKGMMSHSLDRGEIFGLIQDSDKKDFSKKAEKFRQSLEGPIPKVKEVLGL